MFTMISEFTGTSSYAADRVAADEARDHELVLDTVRVILGRARDAADARFLAGSLFLNEDIFLDACREIRERRDIVRELTEPWTLERVTVIVLGWAHMEMPFSANHFYLTLPQEAHQFIGPAIQRIRRKYLETVGTEIAVNPARKKSRVTVYRLRAAIMAS